MAPLSESNIPVTTMGRGRRLPLQVSQFTGEDTIRVRPMSPDMRERILASMSESITLIGVMDNTTQSDDIFICFFTKE